MKKLLLFVFVLIRFVSDAQPIYFRVIESYSLTSKTGMTLAFDAIDYCKEKSEDTNRFVMVRVLNPMLDAGQPNTIDLIATYLSENEISESISLDLDTLIYTKSAPITRFIRVLTKLEVAALSAEMVSLRQDVYSAKSILIEGTYARVLGDWKIWIVAKRFKSKFYVQWSNLIYECTEADFTMLRVFFESQLKTWPN